MGFVSWRSAASGKPHLSVRSANFMRRWFRIFLEHKTTSIESPVSLHQTSHHQRVRKEDVVINATKTASRRSLQFLSYQARDACVTRSVVCSTCRILVLRRRTSYQDERWGVDLRSGANLQLNLLFSCSAWSDVGVPTTAYCCTYSDATGVIGVLTDRDQLKRFISGEKSYSWSCHSRYPAICTSRRVGIRIHRRDPIVHAIYLRWRGCRTNCRVNQRIVSFPSRNAASSEVSSCVRCLISTEKGGRGRCRPSLFRASIRHDLSAVANLGRAPRDSLWPAGPDACSSFKLPTVAFESTLESLAFPSSDIDSDATCLHLQAMPLI